MSLPNVKSKAIPVTGRGGLLDCEMLKIPHYADNRLTDSGEVESPKHLPRSSPRNMIFLLLILISVRH
jgi:hypothetical protein